MAGFALLTTLSLNAAGFDSGINKVQQKTRDFKKGTEAASRSISSSFSSMGGILGGAVNSQVGMLGSSIMGGVGAFRSMIPAINGVKVALIASGIGAIVVVIGLAFAALSSYLTGTQEGSERLNIIMGYLKGTFNVIIQRVNLMGSALMKLFDGDFKGMADDFQAAFKGGFIDEINEGAKEGIEFGKEANKLKSEKLDLDSEEADMKLKMAQLEVDASNKNKTAIERKKALVELQRLDNYFGSKKADFLKRDWELQEKINKSKGKSISLEDKQLSLDKKVAYLNYVAADTMDDKLKNKLQFQLKTTEATKSYTEAIEDNIKSLEKQREIMFGEGKDLTSITAQINVKKTEKTDYDNTLNGFDLRDSGELLNLPDPQLLEDEINDLIDNIQIEPIKLELAPIPTDSFNGIIESVGSLTSAISGALKESSAEYKAFAIAQAMISTYLAAAGIMANTAKLGPIAMGISMAATIAAGLVNVAKIAKFANGGIVGGNSFSGDRVPALVNSGEMILNSGQQANLFQLANSGNGGNGGEVRFEIEGSKLIGVLNNYNRKTNSYR